MASSAAVVLIALLVVVASGQQRRLSTRSLAADSTPAGRVALWPGGLRAVPGLVLLGAGPDQIERVLAPQLPADFERRFGDAVVTDRAHDELLDRVLAVGILGLVPAAGALATILIACWQGRVDPLAALVGAGLVGYMVHLEFNFSFVQVDLLVAFLAGLALGPTATVRRLGVRPAFLPAVLLGFAPVVPLLLDIVADVAYDRGYQAERHNDLAAAEAAYRAAADATPWQPQVWEVLARFRLRAGAATSAVLAASQASQRSGAAPRWRELEADTQLSAGAAVTAELEYRQLLRHTPNDASLHEGLSRSLAAQHRVADARVELERSLG